MVTGDSDTWMVPRCDVCEEAACVGWRESVGVGVGDYQTGPLKWAPLSFAIMDPDR